MTSENATQQNMLQTLAQVLQKATEYHLAGQLLEAELLYSQILQFQPKHPDVNHNMGVLAVQIKQPASGLPYFRLALEVNPAHGQYWMSYIDALIQAKQHETARQMLEQAQKLGLNEVAVNTLKGRLEALLLSEPNAQEWSALMKLFADRRLADAEALAHAYTVRFPLYAAAWMALGAALGQMGRSADALAPMLQAAALSPGDIGVHNNLGNIFKGLGRLQEAEASYRLALKLNPASAEAHYNLGNVLHKLGQFDKAVESYFRAVEIKPDFAEVYSNLGNALKDQGRIEEAIASYRRALSLKSDFAETHSNLGNALRDLGLLDDAVASYQQALEIRANFSEAHSNLLFALNYHPDLSAEQIHCAYLNYEAQRGMPLRSLWRAHRNDKNPHRRLRIAYVSPDFRHHSTRSFLEPVLVHHDRTQVEVYAYADLSHEDYMTARYQRCVEHWVPSRGLDDAALAERIRSDQIDILIELAGHSANNRLLMLARKPAPVSVNWLGLCYTSGLKAIDYYLTDEATVPLGSEALFSEQPWRVATPAYVYRPSGDAAEINPLPALQRGYVSFGTLTRSVRVNHRTIRVWAEILKAVPHSRLVMNSLNFKDPVLQQKMQANFAQQGINPERLEIGFSSPPWGVLHGIDIGLDCFPHNSGTTLYETLYMGVPFITLEGRASVGRLGSSILQGLGHPEWIAGSEQEYVSKAVAMANNLEQLAVQRANLRREMELSPLLDESGFTRKLESAYRQMWHKWCVTEAAA